MESQALGGLGSQAAQLTLGGAQDFLPVMLRLRPGVSEDLLGLDLNPGQLFLGGLLDGLLGFGTGLTDFLIGAVQLLLGLIPQALGLILLNLLEESGSSYSNFIVSSR